MRAYFFNNFYLSSIQQGIQSAHVVHELFVKYRVTSCGRVLKLHDWAENHKTMIVLNGGHSASLRALYVELEALAEELQLPIASFHEDEDSLDGAFTSIGIIVPESIYDSEVVEDPQTPAERLRAVMSRYRLAH
jgi:hypothetical protein